MRTGSSTNAGARQAHGSTGPLRRLAEAANELSPEKPTALERRALAYLQVGQAVHLQGPTGSGKTTLALRVAQWLQRPIMLVFGGGALDAGPWMPEGGARARKADAPISVAGLDEALSAACRRGCTLVYDAFDLDPPLAHAPLRAALEERLLAPRAGNGGGPVHADFRAILTSNPTGSLAGRCGNWEALTDRMITLDLEAFPRETEIAIVVARTGLRPKDAAHIVDIVRDFRESREYVQRPTLRASLMIGGIAAAQKLRVTAADAAFVQLCLDVLGSKLKPDEDGLPDARQRQLLTQLIDHFCGNTMAGADA